MVQERLRSLGYSLADDGVFGPAMENVVKQYQDKHGLTVDGVVGMATVRLLFPEKAPVYTPPKRGKITNLSVLEILERANGSINAPVKYHLEYPNGGTDPDANMPCDEATGFADCVGFVAWCQGFDRYQKGKFPLYDGYINTDSMIDEATQQKKWFVLQSRPQVGDMIVGATYRDGLLRKHIGHIGVIVSVSDWDGQGLAGISVVHCSPGNYKYGPSAIFKTNGLVWKNYPTLRFVRFNREYARSL